MPLITCPDCGHEVSTTAAACPQCGRPMTPMAPQAPRATGGTEETLWRGSPSGTLLLGTILGAVITAIALLAIFYFWYDALAPYKMIVWTVIGVVVLWRFASVAIALARLRATIYTVTTQRVIVESGLATKALEDIDLRYVDDTLFRQRVVERLLGIGDVTIISSDKTTPNAVLRGVSDPRALRELIRTHAYQVSQRQLFTRTT